MRQQSTWRSPHPEHLNACLVLAAIAEAVGSLSPRILPSTNILNPEAHQVLRRRVRRRLEAQQLRRRRRALVRVLQGICRPTAGLAQQAQRARHGRGPRCLSGGAGFCGEDFQG